MKTCTGCAETKALAEFYVAAKGRFGRMARCKSCFAQYRVARRDQINQRSRELRAQNPDRFRSHGRKWRYGFRDQVPSGPCDLCGVAGPRVVDHDHACCPGQKSCGECLRGMLCHSCNIGLGHLGDSVQSIRRAVAYLEDPPGVRLA